jgi:hypothetical protein
MTENPSEQPSGQKPPPSCKALLLCDHTIVEAVTGKVSIIGVFGAFVLRTFPGAARPFTAFLQLADGIGVATSGRL